MGRPKKEEISKKRQRKRHLYMNQWGRCYYCKRLMTLHGPRNPREATFEHLKPKADGGTMAAANIVLACRRCNEERGWIWKGDKRMSSYFDERARKAKTSPGAAREVETEVIRHISLLCGDREFPNDLREKMMIAIATKAIVKHGEVEPLEEAIKHYEMMGYSDLVEALHDLCHDLARRKVQTRFGWLNDSPLGNLTRRDDEDGTFIVTEPDEDLIISGVAEDYLDQLHQDKSPTIESFDQRVPGEMRPSLRKRLKFVRMMHASKPASSLKDVMDEPHDNLAATACDECKRKFCWDETTICEHECHKMPPLTEKQGR